MELPRRVDEAEFGAPTAHVDDERLLGNRPPLGHADDHEQRLFLVRQHMHRRARRDHGLVDDARGVGGPSDGLGAEERHVGRPEPAGQSA